MPTPTRHRAPIRRVHADGTICTHKIAPSGRPRDGQDCPGPAGYRAVCTCGQWKLEAGIRAYVEEQRSLHLHSHDTPARPAEPRPPAAAAAEVRIVAAPEQAGRIAAAIGGLFPIASQSPPSPRRREEGRVAIYLRLGDDDA